MSLRRQVVLTFALTAWLNVVVVCIAFFAFVAPIERQIIASEQPLGAARAELDRLEQIAMNLNDTRREAAGLDARYAAAEGERSRIEQLARSSPGRLRLRIRCPCSAMEVRRALERRSPVLELEPRPEDEFVVTVSTRPSQPADE